MLNRAEKRLLQSKRGLAKVKNGLRPERAERWKKNERKRKKQRGR